MIGAASPSASSVPNRATRIAATRLIDTLYPCQPPESCYSLGCQRRERGKGRIGLPPGTVTMPSGPKRRAVAEAEGRDGQNCEESKVHTLQEGTAAPPRQGRFPFL